MKIKKDHDNFDYLSVSLKRDYAERIIRCYHALGWKDVHTEEDKDYEDMKYVLFTRPHVLPNKDRLQYIQVRMENILNRASKRYINKHRKSTALAVVLGLVGLLFVGGGLCLRFILPYLIAKIFGWICVGIGAICLLGLIYPLTKVRKDENKRLKESTRRDMELFEKLVTEAAELSSAQVDLNSLNAGEIPAREGV